MFSIFKNKKPPQRSYSRQPSMGIPTERIRSLRMQGLSDPEIIRTLREEGFSPLEVDKGMKDSMKDSVAPSRPPTSQPTLPNEPLPYEPMSGEPMPQHDTSLPRPGEPFPGPIEGKRFVFPNEEPRRPPPTEPQPMGLEMPPRDELEGGEYEEELPPLKPLPQKRTHMERKIQSKRELEETVESVVDEKWMEFERRSGELTNKILNLETKLSGMEKFIGDLQTQKKTELDEIKGMITTYKSSMEEITGKMSSLENAMKDSLTPMMQSLRSLSDTIKLMKERRRV